MPSQGIYDRKTLLKSPHTKKVRTCLEYELFNNPSVETTQSIFNPEPPLDQPPCKDNSKEDVQNLISAVLKIFAELG